jgi:hypothetical protein
MGERPFISNTIFVTKYLRLYPTWPAVQSSVISKNIHILQITDYMTAFSSFIFCIPSRDSLIACSSLMITCVGILLDGTSREQDSPSQISKTRESILVLHERGSAEILFSRFNWSRESKTSIVLSHRPSSTYSRRLSPSLNLLLMGLFPVTVSNMRIP